MMRMLLGALFTCMAMQGAAAQDADAEAGGALFRFHCATCHGLDARGGGPMAPALVLQPVDLTGLAAGNGGIFPTFRVVARIDGREPLVSHGSPMPVYGDFFAGTGAMLRDDTGQPIATSPAIADLVAWIESVQAD